MNAVQPSSRCPTPPSPIRRVRTIDNRTGQGCRWPSEMHNVVTRETFRINCGSAKSSKCPHCAEVKRRDIAAIARSGWVASDDVLTRAYFLTLTAPGQDRVRWDRSKCLHAPGLRCSGKMGCKVDEIDAAAFHGALAGAWSHFLTDVRRVLNPGCTGAVADWPITVDFLKTYEPQERGVLHVHVMLRVTGVVTDRRLRAALRMCASRHGFGPQLDVQQVSLECSEDVAKAAGYTAKYCAKSSDMLGNYRKLDRSTGELSVGGFRAWSSSMCWGLRMWQIQQRRKDWAISQGAGSGDRASGLASTPGSGATLDSYSGSYASSSLSALELPVSVVAALV